MDPMSVDGSANIGTDCQVEVLKDCDNLDSVVAQTSTVKEQENFNAASELLLEIEDLVNKLHTRARELRVLHGNRFLSAPGQVIEQLRNFLAKGGLDELPDESKHEARLSVLGALGLCLKEATHVSFLCTGIIGDPELSVLEVEALYRPLESSTVFKTLLYSAGKKELKVESWLLLADILLHAKGLEDFYGYDMSVSGLGHVAKAVGASTCPLPLLSLYMANVFWERGAIFSEEGAGHVATLVRAAPNLQSLSVGPWKDESARGGKVLGQAVASHQSLKRLHLRIESISQKGEEEVGVDSEECGPDGQRNTASIPSDSIKNRKMSCSGLFLQAAFLGLPRNTSIHSLELGGRSNPAERTDLEVLSQVLQNSLHITKLTLWTLNGFRSRDLDQFFHSLQSYVHLQSLELGHSSNDPSVQGVSEEDKTCMGIDANTFASLTEVLKSTAIPHLKRFVLDLGDREDTRIFSFDWPAFYMSLRHNKALESVELRGHVGTPQAEREILEWIQSTTLQELEFSPRLRSGEGINWSRIFRSLRDNSHLRCLKIRQYRSMPSIMEDGYRELMAMLHVNSALEEVDLRGSISEEREATVREALKSKARKETYLAELRKGLSQEHTKWQSPKCGRVFLCGLPEAGKTRLTLSMLKLAKGKSFLKKLKEKVLPRTKGIEIHTLRNDEHMQVTLWDLAGQHIFRTLQEFLFPKLSRASLFLFVFSPFDKTKKPFKLKGELQKAFEEEFTQWLKLIASNSVVVGFSLPEVMVIISHNDLAQDLGVKWTEKILAKLVKEFEDVIHIHDKPYFINGHDLQDVQPIVDNLYYSLDRIFEDKLFKVPVVCSYMSQELVTWASRNPYEPIIDDKRFFSLCEKVPDLVNFSHKSHEDDKRRVLKAIGSYLHDVGTVIDMPRVEMPELNMMVVNPNWLTNTFLGKFISIGHKFQQDLGEESDGSVDGFLCETDFQLLLQDRFVKPMQKLGFTTLTQEKFQRLMENLDLSYEIKRDEGKSDSRYFVPVLFKPRSVQNLEWHQTTSTSCLEILGMRLRCKDSKRMHLSPSFFTRFQVTIWRRLMDQLSTDGIQIDCQLNVISLLVDGFDIFIENDQDGDFIDVLVKANKSRRSVWKFVEKYIVEELRDFCASSRGCPGVELVMEIIRKECVRLLTPCHYRKKQAVSRVELGKKFKNALETQDEYTKDRSLYSHTWEKVPAINLQAGCEEAIDLLPPSDIDEVYKWIRERTQHLRDRMDTLARVVKQIDNSSGVKLTGSEGWKNSPGKTTTWKSKSEKWVGYVHPGTERLEGIIHDLHQDVKTMGQDIKEVLEVVKELRSEVVEMNSLQRMVAKNVSQISQQLDRVLGNREYSKQTPKRPYFTRKDVGVMHRITAMMNIGRSLMLHFQCEERTGNHFVPMQPGYELIVDQENKEVLRMVSKSAVQVIWYLLKAGLHVTTGMGDLIPELESSDGQYTRLSSLSMSRLLTTVDIQDEDKTSYSSSPDKAWLYLQDFLKSHLEDKITEHFLLHSIEYFDNEPSHAWLCQECVEKGLREKRLRKI